MFRFQLPEAALRSACVFVSLLLMVDCLYLNVSVLGDCALKTCVCVLQQIKLTGEIVGRSSPYLILTVRGK